MNGLLGEQTHTSASPRLTILAELIPREARASSVKSCKHRACMYMQNEGKNSVESIQHAACNVPETHRIAPTVSGPLSSKHEQCPQARID